MPRAATANGGDWQSCPVPQTPLQRGAFLDLCTKWLTAAHDDAVAEEEALAVRTTHEGAAPGRAPQRALGLARADLALHQARACATCGAHDDDDLAPVVVNPFARAPLALLCARCRDAE
jgi:hypothetical protein